MSACCFTVIGLPTRLRLLLAFALLYFPALCSADRSQVSFWCSHDKFQVRMQTESMVAARSHLACMSFCCLQIQKSSTQHHLQRPLHSPLLHSSRNFSATILHFGHTFHAKCRKHGHFRAVQRSFRQRISLPPYKNN